MGTLSRRKGRAEYQELVVQAAEDKPTPAAPKPEPGPSVSPAKPERDIREEIMRRAAKVYGGGPHRGDAVAVCRDAGEAGGPGGPPRSADEFIWRYHKLRNS